MHTHTHANTYTPLHAHTASSRRADGPGRHQGSCLSEVPACRAKGAHVPGRAQGKQLRLTCPHLSSQRQGHRPRRSPHPPPWGTDSPRRVFTDVRACTPPSDLRAWQTRTQTPTRQNQGTDVGDPCHTPPHTDQAGLSQGLRGHCPECQRAWSPSGSPEAFMHPVERAGCRGGPECHELLGHRRPGPSGPRCTISGACDHQLLQALPPHPCGH